MNKVRQLDAGQQAELLRDAVSCNASLTVTCKLDQGWVRLHSRLLTVDPELNELMIAYPRETEEFAPHIDDGQCLEIGLRRADPEAVGIGLAPVALRVGQAHVVGPARR